jgi:tripartite-type tricarboxylate transporter receptor subunit TctC
MDVRDAVFCFAMAVVLPLQPAEGQEYPNKPIRFVAPQPPGGTFDYTVRVLAERLQASLGQPVIVENRPGAGTVIGSDFVARQPPDGYTLLMGSDTLSSLPSLTAKLPFDPIKDFTPIGSVATPPFVLVVSSSSPIRTVNEYIAAARAKPGSITFGSSGVGTPFQFAGELLKSMANIDMLHVPYKGAAQVVQALLTGELASSFAPLTPLLPHIGSGKLRPLAAVGSTRTTFLPDLPTIMEAVPLPGYAIEAWFGVLGPAGMPRALVDRLNGDINRIVRDPKFVKEKLLSAGLEPMGGTPQQLHERLQADIAKYARIAKDARIQPE